MRRNHVHQNPGQGCEKREAQKKPVGYVGKSMYLFLFFKAAAEHLNRHDQQGPCRVVTEDAREMPARVIHLKPAEENDDQGHHGQIAGNQDEVFSTICFCRLRTRRQRRCVRK